MNILILTTHLNRGGISRYVINLAKGLKKRNHQLWVACAGGEWIDKLKIAGVQYKFIPINTKSICSVKIILSFFILAPLILKGKIQLIHSNTRVTQYLAFILQKFFNIPTVNSFHGFHRDSSFRKIFKLSGIKSIAVSFAVKRYLVDDLKFKENDIRVVYNGLDEEEFNSVGETADYKLQVKKTFQFKYTDFLIGILGRISEEKGHFLAIEAMQPLFAKYDDIYLLISGEGRLEKELKTMINKLNIQERVMFINAEAKDFLNILDLLIVPSRKEGFGYAIIEAFQKGVPVIGFNTGGIAEIIKDKINGILFYEYSRDALKSAIEEIIENDSLRCSLVKNAYQALPGFTLEKMAVDTEKVYEEAVRV